MNTPTETIFKRCKQIPGNTNSDFFIFRILALFSRLCTCTPLFILPFPLSVAALINTFPSLSLPICIQLIGTRDYNEDLDKQLSKEWK